MRLRDLLDEARLTLEASGVPDAGHDAAALLAHAFLLSYAELAAEYGRSLSAADAFSCQCFRSYVSRRAAREPLQHIIGSVSFMGQCIRVSPKVLIPRFDTEVLAETVLREERKREISLLDLCTGSGCIAIALKALGGYAKVTASDISEDALALAYDNALANETDITFIRSDLFADIDGSFDVIVSNPPYISTDEIASLEPEVRDFDPLIALDGGADGLCFMRDIAREAIKALKDGGRLYLEIGADQADSVPEILLAEGYGGIKVVQDLCGLTRVVCSQRSL